MDRSQRATKNKLLEVSKKLVPGTIDIGHCDEIEKCMDNRRRLCDDVKNLCISCKDQENVVMGGLSFLFDVVGPLSAKNGIAVFRYGQAGNYATMIKGDGIKDIMEKFEKDEKIKEITERTQFIKDERKEAEDLKTIESFRRHIDNSDIEAVCVLVTKKNSSGGYDNLDMELIKIAKEKENTTGKKIKIIDQSEIDRKFYILGFHSKKLIKKLELEANAINESDSRINIFVIPVKSMVSKKDQADYAGILTINSIDDDVANVDDNKELWKKHFTEKYKGLEFISAETFKPERTNEDVKGEIIM